jgi:hypothetical protein
MLLLTDNGPLLCDSASHAVRDMRTGRPRMTPQEFARDDARLRRMVREWADSKRRSTKDNKMTFDAATLFQRADRPEGSVFADHVAARKNPLKFWRGKLREASRTVSRHAFDSGSDREEALKHVERMANHISARGGSDQFDPAYLARCFKGMLAAMGGTEEEAEDDEDELPTGGTSHGGPIRRAKDRVGETPARSIMELTGRSSTDHRKDFNSSKGAGADSAYGFDADALFQRVAR